MSLLEAAYKKYTQHDPESADDLPSTGPSMQSVDMLRKKLLRERRGELQLQAAGDWGEIKSDIGKLLAFADLEANRQIRESGSIPDTYTTTTFCSGCRAEVPMFPGVPDRVDACPWCVADQSPPPIPA